MQLAGIEPTSYAWKAYILPLNYSSYHIVKINFLYDLFLKINNIFMQSTGIEPVSYAWRAYILPLNYDCYHMVKINFPYDLFLVYFILF